MINIEILMDTRHNFNIAMVDIWRIIKKNNLNEVKETVNILNNAIRDIRKEKKEVKKEIFSMNGNIKILSRLLLLDIFLKEINRVLFYALRRINEKIKSN